jgi:S-phase kinase-associated protein 1
MSSPAPSLSLDSDDFSSSSAPVELTLISKDGTRFSLPRSASLLSELIKTTLEGDPDASELPLYHIESTIVSQVIHYLNYHEKVPPRRIESPLTSNVLKDLVDHYDSSFINQDQETVFKLLLAANYLNIKPLFHLCCAKVATLIKGKTAEQIRSTFNIRQDFTAAEEEEVRREYKDLIG